MALTKRQLSQLQKVIETIQAILSEVDEAKSGKAKAAAPPSRIRRAGKELEAFRKQLRAERKKGVPVAEIAKKHNVSKAYVYQL